MKYREQRQVVQVLNHLDKQRMEASNLCDIVIKVKNQEFHAHRCVLAASSEYFKTLFSSSFCDKNEQVHELHVGNPVSLATILDYIYTGQISLQTNKILDLLMLSDYLLVPRIRELSAMHIIHSLEKINLMNVEGVPVCPMRKNWVKILKIAERFNLLGVQQRITEYLAANTHHVIQGRRIMEAPFSILKSILCNHRLNYLQEGTLFDLVVRWVRHDLKKRRHFFSLLFSFLHLEFMPNYFIQTRVLTEPLCSPEKHTNRIYNHLKCKNEVRTKDVIVMFAGDYKNERHSLQQPDLLPLNNDNKSNIIRILGYSVQDDLWFNIGNLELTLAQDASNTCSVEYQGRVYVLVAGLIPIFAYLDLEDKQSIWHRLTPPGMFPYAHALAATESFVFALGDSGSMVKYSIAEDKWDNCTNCLITYPHVQNLVYHMVSHKEYLYVIIASSVFYYELQQFMGDFSLGEYDIEHDRWRRLPKCDFPEGSIRGMTRFLFSVYPAQDRLVIMQEHGQPLAVYDIPTENWVIPEGKSISTPTHVADQIVDKVVCLKNNNSQLLLFSSRGGYQGMSFPGCPTLAQYDNPCGVLKMKASPVFRYNPQETVLCATQVSAEAVNGFT